MTDIIPTLTHATERDIDLLIVEEALANRHFVDWLASNLDLPKQFATWDVIHSKRRTRSRREIDICIETFSEDGAPMWVLLIENKIDAQEQPDQAESYRKELQSQYDGHHAAKMALICPESYASAKAEFSDKFDAVISYEALSEFFEDRCDGENEASKRARFRRDCLLQAINKHRRGYRKIANPVIKDFNAQYVALMRNLGPALIPGKTMLEPSKPNESVSMILDNSTLKNLPVSIRPRRFSIELGKGKSSRANYVAATFGGWGRFIIPIKQHFEAHEKDELTIFLNLSFDAKPATKNRPNPGLVISSTTCPINNQADFNAQKDLIGDGILKADLFRRWLETHQDLLTQWSFIPNEN